MLMVSFYRVAAQTTLSTGGADSWNTATNWSAGVPSGTMDAIIASGVPADVNNTNTPIYAGSLSLLSGASLTIQNTVGSTNAYGTTGPRTLHDANLIDRRSGNISIPALAFEGSGSVNCPSIGANAASFGSISGSGQASFTLNGNNKYILSVSNSISGGMVFVATGKSAAVFDAPGSGGAGNVTQVPSGAGIQPWLYLRSDDVFDDRASLTLDGTASQGMGGGGGVPTITGPQLLFMNSYSDTVSNLFVRGTHMAPGTYSSVGTSASVDFEVDWIGGNGVLTVLDGPVDETAPTVSFEAVDANGGAGPIYPGEPVTYTITFDEPIIPDLTASDLENASTGSLIVERVTKNSDTQFVAIVSAPEGAATLVLQISTNSVIADFFGNDLVTPAVDDQTFTVDPLPLVVGQLGVWSPWANGRMNPATGNAWKAGDQYRLIFITSTARDAAATDISVYNDFVQGVAASSTTYTNLGDVTWNVVGSTSNTSARVNTGTDGPGGVPVLLMDGYTAFAANNADLWDGAPVLTNGPFAGTYAVPFYDQNGSYGATWVWTGTASDGTTPATEYLGDAVAGKAKRASMDGNSATSWITTHNATLGTSQRYYGLSEPLTLQSTAPAGTVLILR